MRYKVDPVQHRGQPCPLNPDHTHFIMVDDGKRNKYGGEQLMRAGLKECIQLSPDGKSSKMMPVFEAKPITGIPESSCLYCVEAFCATLLCSG